ncbi:outer membrane protein assembly factor BamC [Ideonella sp. B508-1]|uniref:outer membrane protein assembly factor BamC n=1 Tax=Ideonella sp. B508-1 TaxID=137716 RepID=UPI00034A5CE3|nr:outer membrane protein assembly factor BamC [Ideonella sp. B508-1]
MKQAFSITAVRGATLALAASLAGCGMLSSVLPDDKIDYGTASRKVQPLDVPPDLTQLARDNRYAPQAGTVSASALGSARPATTPGAAATPTVAIDKVGDTYLARMGQQQWLVSPRSPEEVWPLVRQFFLDRNFKFTKEDAASGVLETDWVENRANLPKDLIRSTIGQVLDRLYDSGLRDRFTIRVLRGTDGKGSEVYIAHHGLEEVVTNRDGSTTWTNRAADPALETELLTRLMQTLSPVAAAATPASGASAPDATTKVVQVGAKARVLSGQPGATLEVDDGLERTWRRVGLALDRTGFTVEERDRALATYAVRYVDPKIAGQDSPNFISKLFGAKEPAELALGRYRIVLKTAGNSTQITVQKPNGDPDNSESAQRIAQQLVDELKY